MCGVEESAFTHGADAVGQGCCADWRFSQCPTANGFERFLCGKVESGNAGVGKCLVADAFECGAFDVDASQSRARFECTVANGFHLFVEGEGSEGGVGIECVFTNIFTPNGSRFQIFATSECAFAHCFHRRRQLYGCEAAAAECVAADAVERSRESDSGELVATSECRKTDRFYRRRKHHAGDGLAKETGARD